MSKPLSPQEVIRLRHGTVSFGRRAVLTLRSCLYWAWQVFATLLMGGPVLLGSLVSFDVGYYFARLWIRMNVHGLRIICGVRWDVQGAENIPDTPCVVFSKHQSTWETYFIPMLLVPATYVAKRSLAWIPIFGWALVALNMILIDRKSGRSAVRQMVEQARDRLARGRWIIIFPEGTRRPVGAAPNYRAGGAVVATELEAPVLPIALNAGEFWPRLGFIKWPGTITVRIGPTLSTAGRSVDDVLSEAEGWIEANTHDMSVLNDAVMHADAERSNAAT